MEYTIKKLSPEILPAFLEFFDHIAFKDNPNWDGCYCHFYHFIGTQAEWVASTKEQNRINTIEEIQQGKKPGYLIFSDSQPIGWVNAGLKTSYPGLKRLEGVPSREDNQIISIVCFIIDPSFRKQGIASRLLDYICISYPKHIIEAYPRINVVGDDVHYHGPLSMYKKHGFESYQLFEKFVIVRRNPT